MCTKAPEFCSRNRSAQARLMLKEPLRCTASTSDQSDQLMRWKMRSRKMPALLTRMSTRPKAASAAFTISSAFFGSAIDSVEAIASPPPRLISSTTSCAGEASVPAPSRLAPMSQTTMAAPSPAIVSAMPRPMPRPAPVTIATLPATIPVMTLSLRCGRRRVSSSVYPPDLVRDLDEAAQLCPLLVLAQQIALLGRGEAAVAGNAERVERGIFRRLLDAALELVLAFELAVLGGHDAEHDELAFGQHAQRFEAAGTRIVVLHEISVHLDLAEQDFLHRFVAAGAHEGRFIIAAAQMHGDGHVGGNIRHRRVDEIAVKLAEAFGIIAARGHLRPVFRIAQHGHEDLVELEVAAAGVGEGAHRLAVGLPQVGEEAIELGIDGLVDGRHHRAAVDRRGRGNRDLRRAIGVRLHEFEMLDHRMAGKSELAGDAHPLVAGRNARKCDAGIHDVAFDAVEAPEKIEMPPGAAELAVGDGLQPHLLLLLDHAFDLAVLDRLEFRHGDLALRALLARRLQRRRPQEAAHVIGAEWGFGSLHDWTCLAGIIASLWSASSPHLFRHLHDPPQLRPLLVLGQDIAFLARGEAALRGEAERLASDEFRRLVDAALDRVLGFERAAFGGDEAEHHHLALGHEAQRFEAAGAVAVVFHEVGIDIDLVEQNLRHRLGDG